MQALKKTCNNKAAACEWLCGNRTGSLVELREGLAQDSPILKTILQLPQVQLSLSNPEILLGELKIQLSTTHTVTKYTSFHPSLFSNTGKRTINTCVGR